jgi:hypothetical protein
MPLCCHRAMLHRRPFSLMRLHSRTVRKDINEFGVELLLMTLVGAPIASCIFLSLHRLSGMHIFFACPIVGHSILLHSVCQRLSLQMCEYTCLLHPCQREALFEHTILLQLLGMHTTDGMKEDHDSQCSLLDHRGKIEDCASGYCTAFMGTPTLARTVLDLE